VVEKVRTTIVLPRETFRRAKLHSVQTEQTLSEFIAGAVEQALGPSGETEPPELPVGKYAWGNPPVPARKELYAQTLRRKVPA
jgi:hypothetical protein